MEIDALRVVLLERHRGLIGETMKLYEGVYDGVSEWRSVGEVVSWVIV